MPQIYQLPKKLFIFAKEELIQILREESHACMKDLCYEYIYIFGPVIVVYILYHNQIMHDINSMENKCT